MDDREKANPYYLRRSRKNSEDILFISMLICAAIIGVVLLDHFHIVTLPKGWAR